LARRRHRRAARRADPGQEALSTIYHLALAPDWARACDGDRRYRVSTIGRTLDEVGFIHCSFARQVRGVADAFYRGRSDVVLLTIDRSRVSAPIRDDHVAEAHDVFPHIYGPLDTDAVIAVELLARRPDGTLALPELDEPRGA
jgi:glutathione S-transferase